MPLIYIVGQDVGLSVTPEPALSGAPSLTVTDPVGVETTPAVASASGTYTAVVQSVSAAGIWRYRWESAADGFAAEGQFQVQAAGLEQLVDLASVKAHLNLPEDDTRADDELTGFIYAAADMARDFCGPFLPETHTQFFSGSVPSVYPDWAPLTSVLSVTEFYGLSAYVLTEQPLGGQTDAYSYTVDYSTGQITRRTMGGGASLFAAGDKNIKVVYTAGRSGAVPYSVRLGALELIRHLYQITQQGGRPKFGSGGMDTGDPMTSTGYALPNRVQELWAPFRRPPGVA